jgi:hypothetical protein
MNINQSDYADPMDQYKEEIGDIPAKIKALEKKVDAYLLNLMMLNMKMRMK